MLSLPAAGQHQARGHVQLLLSVGVHERLLRRHILGLIALLFSSSAVDLESGVTLRLLLQFWLSLPSILWLLDFFYGECRINLDSIVF